MKKFILFFLTIVMSISLIGCNNINGTNNSKDGNKKEDAQVIPMGQTFKTEKYEITINDYSWVTKIEPTNPGEQFNFYDAEENSTLLKINAKIKNLSSDSLNVDGIAYEATINNKYNYKLQTVIDKGGNLEPLAMVKPLEEVNVIIFTNIPNEAKNEMTSLRLYCGYNDEYDNQFDTFESKKHIVEFSLEKKQQK